MPFLPFPKRHILLTSKLKEFADDNFKFDENGKKFSKRVENTVGKGEIALYEQFLLFPLCFQKTSTTRKNQGLFGKGLTAKVISWQTVRDMCFLAFSHQYLHNFSFQSHRLLSSHASAEVRGKNTSQCLLCGEIFFYLYTDRKTDGQR